ncbi:MAG: tetratricopeptide repeat protein [Nitrospinae bacterium]|nr:tetratricopeptide repeat protein [Nitrospinota bacterium]
MELLLIPILFIGFLMRIPYMNFPIDEDIGFYTYLANFRKRGVRFVRDYFGWLTPVVIYFYLFISKLFGEDIKYVRHLSNFYNLLTIISTFMVTDYLFGATPALIASLIYAIFSASPYLGVYSCHAEGFYVLPLTLGVFTISHGLLDDSSISFLYAGGFFATTFLLKIVNIIYFASFLLFLLVKYELVYSLYFSLSFIAVVLLHTLLIAWLYKGENRRLWSQHQVRWNTCIGYIDNSLKGMWKRFKVDFYPVWRETSSIIILSFMYLFLGGQGIAKNILLIWTASSICILVSQRVFRMYHYIPIVHVTSIMSALVINELIKADELYSSYFIIPSIIAISFIFSLNIYHKLYFLFLYMRDKRQLYFQKADQFFYIPEIAKHIKERTTPDEYIYVWGPFVQIYRLADRLSCERFLFHFVRPYTWWHTYLFDEILTGIISKKPAYVVMVRPDFNTDILRQITGLDYALERVFFNRYRVYRLREKVSKPMILSDMKQEDKIKWLEYLTPGSMNYRIDDYYLKKGMYKEAGKEFEEGLKLNPNDLLMKFGMANLMRNRRQYGDAFRLYKGIAEVNKKEEWLHLEKGVTYREMGDMENALREFEKEEKLYPGKADIHHHKGITYRMQRKYNEALREFNKALVINPMAEWVHNEMGIAYKEIGEINNALKELENEERLYPEKIITRYNIYSLAREAGRSEYAREGFLMLIEDKEASIDIKAGCYFHLGKIYMEDKKNSEAIESFKKCLSLLPMHERAKEYLGWLEVVNEGQIVMIYR